MLPGSDTNGLLTAGLSISFYQLLQFKLPPKFESLGKVSSVVSSVKILSCLFKG